MADVIGIIPGAGRASRIGGFFKELTPINVNASDGSKFVVVSERIIDLMRRAGAQPIYFVLNSDKSIVSEYFNKSGLFASESLYFSFQSNLDQFYGMPFAIDKIYREARGKTVLLGMPDTLIEPDQAFEILLARFKEHQADLELGLFRTEPDCYGGFIQTDQITSRVISHIDKTAPRFPRTTANNSWAVACWNDRFTEFLHRFIENKREDYRYNGFGQFPELLFGDVIDAAIADRQMSVAASFISLDKGYYLDITEPTKYFQAVLHYHAPRAIRTSQPVPAGSLAKPSVFISHSSAQKQSADDLHLILSQAGYDPKLDSYDIRPGQQISKKIEALVHDADFFVLLLTQESLASKWVTAEVTFAYAAGFLEQERLLPVQLDPIPDEACNSVPFIPKNSYNWMDGTKGLRPVLTWLQEHPFAWSKRGLTSR